MNLGPMIVIDASGPIAGINDARPGDRVILRPGHSEATVLLVRDLPNALLDELRKYAMQCGDDQVTYLNAGGEVVDSRPAPRRAANRKPVLRLLPRRAR